MRPERSLIPRFVGVAVFTLGLFGVAAGARPSGAQVPSPSTPTPILTITTAKSSYAVGEIVQICYSVPGPDPITITDIRRSSSTVILSGSDDGSGNCISARVTPPTGQECFRLEYVGGDDSRSTQSCMEGGRGAATLAKGVDRSV